MDELIKKHPAMAKALEGVDDLPLFDEEFVETFASGLVPIYKEYLAIPENNAKYKKWLKNKRRREKRHEAKVSDK